jgi:tetratricopeptide (TPR) repeat protein
MRDLLQTADLDRYAGQFVWLELNYDLPRNQEFLSKFGANATPTFFVIDPHDEQVTATQPGAMSLAELKRFLERGASGVSAKNLGPGDSALARGDALRAAQPAEAVKAYQEALRLAPADWSRHSLAEASLAGALQDSKQWQECAQTAADEAAKMQRDETFARTVVAGMWCLVAPDQAPWTESAAERLVPLAKEALLLPTTVRDHRDELYRTLMYLAVSEKDNAAAGKWGEQWLAELDAIKPQTDDERSALDIARVENIQVYGDPDRILPALAASEQAMPHNYIASLRLAEMELAAKRYDAAIAACDRGLARGAGANGRAWLLRMKAEALEHKGQRAQARRALEEALKAAQQIPTIMGRDMNVKMISTMLKEEEKPVK